MTFTESIGTILFVTPGQSSNLCVSCHRSLCLHSWTLCKHHQVIYYLSIYLVVLRAGTKSPGRYLSLSSFTGSMSPSSLPTIRASHASTLDGKKGSDQDHRVEDGSPFLDEKGYEVRLEPEDDPHQLSLCRRWLAIATISGASLCVACASSLASIHSLVTRMRASYLNYFRSLSGCFYCRRRGIAILGISLYVMGLGTGPLLSGPLSEVYGRIIVYRVSFILFLALTFPVAFAPHISSVAWTSIRTST